MKLLTKNNYNFASGMFWQIPEEGKRNLNISKLIKDTKHNMFCFTKTINPTWGFCHKEDLNGIKKVASLGKFIAEASSLTANYTNSIICYKFKGIGELDSDGKPLESALYGYIVLLNGTICPDDGEYVSEFAAVRESIIQKSKRHEIETLYLPIEVASNFFSIFEILNDAYTNDELLKSIIQNLTSSQRYILKGFINNDFNYEYLFNDLININLKKLRELIKSLEFENILKQNKDQMIKYLISSIYILPFTSDDIYWYHPNFNSNFNRALIKPISTLTHNKHKVALLFVLIIIGGCMIYDYFVTEETPLATAAIAPPSIPRALAVTPASLIDSCLIMNDRFFKDLGTWTFNSLKCDSLAATLTFVADTETTLSEFKQLIGTDKNISLRDKIGIYTQKIKIIANNAESGTYKIPKEQVLTKLQQAAINYQFILTIPEVNSSNNFMHQSFSILSQLSPIFLLNKGILDNVKLKEINMAYDSSTGFYSWTLQGEF
jgi:hypothetical protein